MGRARPVDWLPPLAAAAGAVALFAVPWFLPLAGSVITFASPLPLVLAYRTRGPWAGRRALLLAALITFGLLQLAAPPGGGYYLLYFLVMAAGLGELPCLGLPERWGVGAGAAGGMAAVLLLLVVASMLSGASPWQMWRAQWSLEMATVLDVYRAMDLDPDTLRQIEDGLRLAERIVLHLAPGILAGVSLMVAWLNMLGARRLAARLGGMGPAEDLTLYRTPEPLVYLIIAGGCLMVLGSGWVFWTGANLVLVMGLLYFLQGLAVTDFWLRAKNAPVLLRWALYLLVALEFYLAAILAAVGLFDIWLNLRRRKMNLPPESEE
ncbi:MAG: YybS family protein [Desulfarculaceae bacterium]|nr:YybS family protein [Desulfarculaceae bacterium]MCF8073369.1 YybS family protein [Desulfarculaceae bacterium]MCF8103521.1 YybS family protein [Desulfarculaceae bacterium]MCF8115780.1 YybS family protein [Desulfarculaceae bacterium]